MDTMSPHNTQWMPAEFENGLFSVIVPTYNRAHILTEALDSVWAQTYRPIELIVVDDGSVDDTGRMVETWNGDHQGDEQFEFRFLRQENGGAHAARNRGLIHSKGEYIQHLDSDDAFYPEMVARVVQAFEDMGFDFVLVGYDKFCYECGKAFYSYVPEPDTDALTVYMKGKLFGNSVSIARKRQLIREIGPWNETLINDADGDYLVRTILHSPHMAVVRERLFAYQVRRGPTLSDSKGSSKSWQCYVDRERMFCDGIKGKDGIPTEARGMYAQRLYERALSLYNEGLPEIGEAFGTLADGVQNPALTRRGRWIQKAWRNGRKIYAGYQWARSKKQQAKKFIARQRSDGLPCPVCGR